MKLIVGLGNPGEKYIHTRHNAGFMFVDFLFEDNEIVKPWKFDKYANTELAEIKLKTSKSTSNILLAKPQTFMNRSGETVTKLAIRNSLSPAEVYVAHDDLDIKLGEYKVSLGKGPKLHNGTKSIEEIWKTNEFWRIRIGVDDRTEPIPGETYVLSSFLKEEFKTLDTIFETIIKEYISLKSS